MLKGVVESRTLNYSASENLLKNRWIIPVQNHRRFFPSVGGIQDKVLIDVVTNEHDSSKFNLFFLELSLELPGGV